MTYLLILTSVPSLGEARKLARILLKKKLAACIQIAPPVESYYAWKGKNVQSREFPLVIKSKAPLYARIEKIIIRNHSYEVPEIIVLPIQKGSRNYLQWLGSQTQPKKKVK